MRRATTRSLTSIAAIGFLTLAACGGGGDSGDRNPRTAIPARTSRDFCRAIAKYQNAYSKLPTNPAKASEAELEGPYAELSIALDEMQDTAPSHMEDAVNRAATIYEWFITAFAQAEYDFSRLISDPAGEEAVQAYASEEMFLALADIEAYDAQRC